MKKKQQMIGDLAATLRSAKGWSEGQLSSEIMLRYGDSVTPEGIRSLEAEGNGTLRLVTLVFGALRNLRKDQLNDYFIEMLRYMTNDQSITNRKRSDSAAPQASAEL